MRNKRISSDSCSDDDVPLKVIKINRYNKDPNSYDSLCQHSIEPCEFCERISKNRYSSLIHNVRHIIIPLLNQAVIQCKTCLHHFTSEEDLRTHLLKKHPNLKIIPQANIVKRNNELSNNQLSLSPSTAGNRHVPITTNKLQTQVYSCIASKESEVKFSVKKFDEPIVASMKNRLVFEDDDVILLDCDQLLNDLTTDCKVNLEVFETPWLVDDEFSRRSIHYDDLVKPGVYRCKKCGEGFPIRYDAIIHETSHLTIKNSQVSLCIICNQYTVGDRSNLRLHYLTHHKQKCEIHTQTYAYHEPEYITDRKINIDEVKTRILEEKIDVSVDKRTFESKIDVTEEKRTFDSKIDVTEDKRTFYSKVIFLCELCFSFCKNKSSTNYEYVKTICQIGKRYRCEKCGMKFFEINIVKRRVLRRTCSHNKKKHTTKEERLKIIANRFKMLKKY